MFEGEIRPSRSSVGYKTTTGNEKKKKNDLIAEGSKQEPARLALQNTRALQGPEASIINRVLIGSGCRGSPLRGFALTPFNFLKLHFKLCLFDLIKLCMPSNPHDM